jgi:ABC-type sugar transport system substrate-binding protein
MAVVSGRIALFLRTLANDYQDLLREDCLAAARRHGYVVEVFSADSDAEKQLRQIREVLDRPEGRRPKGVLVSPVRESLLFTSAQKAAKAGIGWVLLNRWSEQLVELRKEFPEAPIFAVNPDQIRIGRIQARQFKILLPDGGEVFYLQGPYGTSSAHRRFEGAQGELAGSHIKLVPFNSDWSIEGGERTVRDWLRIFDGRDLPTCVIGAQNDNMAMGARMALTNGSRQDLRATGGRICITGCDGSPRFGLPLVKAGELTATVVIPPVAGIAVDELVAALAGGRVPPAEIVVGVSSYPDLPNLAQARAKDRAAADG